MRSRANPNQIGHGKLLVMEEQLDDGDVKNFKLPANAEWKDSHDVTVLLESIEDREPLRQVMETVLKCLQSKSSILLFISDSRHRRGWFRKANAFLVSALSLDGAVVSGRVIQQHMSSTSTLLKVKSSQGWYYLKEPALGCMEVATTAKIASLFPESSPTILRTCDELNCFVSKGFTHVPLDNKDIPSLVQKLGSIQLKSLEHLEALQEAGCPCRDLQALANKIKCWVSGEGVVAFHGEALGQPRFMAPILIDMCHRLDNFNIPLTLVHGDLALSNATYEPEDSQDIIVFDREFACIAHPFCDFHRLDKDAPKEIVDAYLRRWHSYENIERAREAYEIGWKLEWVLKMSSISDYLEACASSQAYPSLQHWISEILSQLFNAYRSEAMLMGCE